MASIPGTLGHLSALSTIPSLSESGSGHPLLLAGPLIFGQSSTESKRPSLSLSTSTGSVSTGVKDAGGVSVLTAVTAGGHTHTAVVPHAVARYIIKT